MRSAFSDAQGLVELLRERSGPPLRITLNRVCKRLRETQEAGKTADIVFMQKQVNQNIVDAARETADTIVGARAWTTAAEATAMHDIIFWDMLARHLPDAAIADLRTILD
ncbi:hypothetical protein [Burkholderia sp. Bp8963]|uniref:hypothetical protein n=1 Tax=Burkholderia sp. Bp8963 TaxID=2184547 RepID=UPI0021AB66CE|nr:hypothetical protein [Burkholderia sp. Bp8963]